MRARAESTPRSACTIRLGLLRNTGPIRNAGTPDDTPPRASRGADEVPRAPLRRLGLQALDVDVLLVAELRRGLVARAKRAPPQALNRRARVERQASRALQHRGDELVAGQHLVHQSELQRLGRADRLGGQQQVEGTRRSEQPPEPIGGSRTGGEADHGLEHRQARRLCIADVAQVAGQGELAARAPRPSVDRRDGESRALGETQQEAMQQRELVDVLGDLIGVLRERLEVVRVEMAQETVRCGADERDDEDSRVALHHVEQCRQLGNHAQGEELMRGIHQVD